MAGCAGIAWAGVVCGCVATSNRDLAERKPSSEALSVAETAPPQKVTHQQRPERGRIKPGRIQLAAYTKQPPADIPPEQRAVNAARPPAEAPKPPQPGKEQRNLRLSHVTESIRQTYPLLESAFLARNIADGEQLAAAGNFDLNASGASESGPLGFHETYRHRFGFDQPLYGGGNVFAGYRIGRGFFQPWFLERETNKGGEFKAGVRLPLTQNRDIDKRRAELWRTTYGRRRVEPEIQAQLIEFVVFGSYAYWEWVAAGRKVEIARSLLELATQRQQGLQQRAEKGDVARIVLTDNERLIISRRAKLTDARQKFRQAAVKLSLFLRQPDGSPFVPPENLLPDSFPTPEPVDENRMDRDIQRALDNRPEFQIFALRQRQLEVDLAQAENLRRPSLDVHLTGSQDVGQPTSSKREKSEFELEAGLFFSVPVQRRKARGKIRAVEGKLAQLAIKRRFTRDKIITEVQTVYAALLAAYQRIGQTRRAFELAKKMEDAERTKFAAGESNLLDVNLRETQTAEAAATLVDALLEYFRARAAYRAALALEVTGQPQP